MPRGAPVAMITAGAVNVSPPPELSGAGGTDHKGSGQMCSSVFLYDIGIFLLL